MEEQNTPNKKKTIAIVGVIAAVAIAVGFALFQPASTAPENPPQPTQSQFSVSESEKQEQKTDVAPTPTEDREATKTAIEDTGNQWLGGELSYDDAIRTTTITSSLLPKSPWHFAKKKSTKMP